MQLLTEAFSAIQVPRRSFHEFVFIFTYLILALQYSDLTKIIDLISLLGDKLHYLLLES